MLLPLVIVSAVSILAARTLVLKLDGVLDIEVQELEPITRLQQLVLRAAMPPNDYLLRGDDAEKDLYEQMSREADEAFAAYLTSPRFGGSRAALVRAHEQWKEARDIGDVIVALSDPLGDPRRGAMMEDYDEHIERASASLEAVHEEAHRRFEAARSEAYAMERRNNIVVAAVLVTSLALAAVGAILLSRSVTVPLLRLKEGILRFHQGDHSFRVNLESKDELGQLADVMNAMAKQLEHDSLTGVYSRRQFDRMLSAEIARSLRYHRVFSLLVLDVDHFKSVNDTHGHASGDEALRAIATFASHALRRADVIGRVGGEEFAIILPETPLEGGLAVAERVRAEIAARPIQITAEKPLNLTVSIGVAVYPDDARAAEELFAVADQALYRAKQAGRNRVQRGVPRAGAVHAPVRDRA